MSDEKARNVTFPLQRRAPNNTETTLHTLNADNAFDTLRLDQGRERWAVGSIHY